MEGREPGLSAPALAALGAVAFALPGAGPWQLVAGTVVGAACGWLSAVDLARHRLPNRVLLPTLAALAVLITAWAVATGDAGGFGRALLGLVGTGGVLALAALATRGGLGFGDVKLGALLGMWTGWLAPAAPAVMLLAAFVVGGVAAIVALARGATGRATLPFGPMLATGAAIASWWAAGGA